jgi:hypothetical protein
MSETPLILRDMLLGWMVVLDRCLPIAEVFYTVHAPDGIEFAPRRFACAVDGGYPIEQDFL